MCNTDYAAEDTGNKTDIVFMDSGDDGIRARKLQASFGSAWMQVENLPM